MSAGSGRRSAPVPPARGGEDLDLFVRLIFAGYSLRYVPSAIVFHDHPRTISALRRHAFDYGVGLTAMLTAQLVGGRPPGASSRHPGRGAVLLRLGLEEERWSPAPGYPRRLRILEMLGMVWGPAAYLASALRGGRWATESAGPANRRKGGYPMSLTQPAHDSRRPGDGRLRPGDINADRSRSNHCRTFVLARPRRGGPYGRVVTLVRLHDEPSAVFELPAQRWRD